MKIELIPRHTMILGMKGSGKSFLAAHILSQPQYRNALIYDLCREHGSGEQERHRLIPENRNGEAAKEEFTTAVRAFITENDRSIRPDLFLMEEMSRYAPNKGGAPDALMDLVDLTRHYGVGIVGTARRAAKVDANMIELADNLIIFSQKGKNSKKRLNSEVSGLGDAAADLDPYHFIVADGERRWSVHRPIEGDYDTTGRL